MIKVDSFGYGGYSHVAPLCGMNFEAWKKVGFGYSEQNGKEAGQAATFVELRRKPRYPVDVEVIIHSHSNGVLKGRTVDLSESGIAAIMKIEVPLSELVQLDFRLPEGLVEIEALVRQRSAFRYGFQFVEQGAPRDLIRLACCRLERDQATKV